MLGYNKLYEREHYKRFIQVQITDKNDKQNKEHIESDDKRKKKHNFDANKVTFKNCRFMKLKRFTNALKIFVVWMRTPTFIMNLTTVNFKFSYALA